MGNLGLRRKSIVKRLGLPRVGQAGRGKWPSVRSVVELWPGREPTVGMSVVGTESGLEWSTGGLALQVVSQQ